VFNIVWKNDRTSIISILMDSAFSHLIPGLQIARNDGRIDSNETLTRAFAQNRCYTRYM